MTFHTLQTNQFMLDAEYLLTLQVQQNDYTKSAMAFQEQLIIDTVVSYQVHGKRNRFTACVHPKKPFNFLPDKCLLVIVNLYGVDHDS